MNNKLVIIGGPTGVGKSDLGIKLAKLIDGQIISADSMQVYKKMNIGTAKIMPEEMDGIKHYNIDVLEPTEEFNVLYFQTESKKAIDEIHAKNKIPIIVGGTGFYIQAVLYDIDFAEGEKDDAYRAELEDIAKEKGADYLHEMLRKVDPKAAESIHKNNIKRVIRAIEYNKITGRLISEDNETQREKESNYDYTYFALTDDREVLYERIDRRVDIMLEKGLIDEVKSLKADGLDKSYISMQGIGYKEILSYLDGEISLEEAIYIIKRDSRRYAKRQHTWLRREKNVVWIDRSKYTNEQEILDFMLKTIGK